MIHWLFSPRVYFWKIRIFWRAFSWHVQLLLAGGELLLAGAKLHNNRILSEEKTQDQPKCNCRQKDTCPLEGHCLDQELIYRCILKENTTSDGVTYNGLTENTFKDRFYKHRNSFKYESKANSTELSKHFWEMKRKGIKKSIMHWSVIDHAEPYQNGSKRI